MTKPQGLVVFGTYEETTIYNWTGDDGVQKPIRSFRVLLPHGDGTVSRESITFPKMYKAPTLKVGEMYGFPVTARLNKKRMQINWDARADLMPFPVPTIQGDFEMEV